MTPLALGAGTVASYLVLYSGYDKATRSLRIRAKVGKILSFADLRFTLHELNKVAGLAGLTLAGAALLPVPPHFAEAARPAAAVLTLAHAGFSALSFFGGSPVQLWFRNPRWFAIVLGQLAIGCEGTSGSCMR